MGALADDAARPRGRDAPVRRGLPRPVGRALFSRAARKHNRAGLMGAEAVARGMFSHLVWHYLAEVYPREHDVMALPCGAARNWDPELVWHFVCRAAAFRSTLASVMRMSEAAPLQGPDTSGGTASYWIRKYLGMYVRARSEGFRGCTRLHVAIDPSTYSGEELMPGTVYSWERQLTASLTPKVGEGTGLGVEPGGRGGLGRGSSAPPPAPTLPRHGFGP